MTDLSELLERVKAATRADREIDCRLSHHFDRKGIWCGTGDDGGWFPPMSVDGWDDAKWAEIGRDYVSPLIPLFTTSIDAALALVERCLPGADWGRRKKGEKIIAEIWWRKNETVDWEFEEASAATDALSIVLALLTLLSALQSQAGK